jgi:aldehyde dehydrogenase
MYINDKQRNIYMRYIDPNQPGSKVQFKSQYENFIGGQWVAL